MVLYKHRLNLRTLKLTLNKIYSGNNKQLVKENRYGNRNYNRREVFLLNNHQATRSLNKLLLNSFLYFKKIHHNNYLYSRIKKNFMEISRIMIQTN